MLLKKIQENVTCVSRLGNAKKKKTVFPYFRFGGLRLTRSEPPDLAPLARIYSIIGSREGNAGLARSLRPAVH